MGLFQQPNAKVGRRAAHLGFNATEGPIHLVVVRLRPDVRYPAAVLSGALFAAGVLSVGYLRLRFLTHHVDASVAVLLAGPALFGALVAAPRSTLPGAQLIVAARAALVVATVLTFLAAGALVALPYGDCQKVVWSSFSVAAWVVVVVLAYGVLRPLLVSSLR